jgi:hypothetical protein
VSVRSLIGILGGIVIISFLTQLLEVPLVNVFAAAPITDMKGYLAARNQPPIHVAMLVIGGITGLLAGYLVAKIAAQYEMQHAAFAAALQSLLLIRGFAANEAAQTLPTWLKVTLVAVTVAAMLLGASVRARAAKLTASKEVES